MRNSETTVTSSGVRVNTDSLAALAAIRAAREAREGVRQMCSEHRAYEADNCPSCGTSRMSH